MDNALWDTKNQERFTDRIDYDGETKDKQPLIDDLAMGNADVHLEMLSDNGAYMILRNDKHYWHLNIWHNGKSPLQITMLEDNSDNPEMLLKLDCARCGIACVPVSDSKEPDSKQETNVTFYCDGCGSTELESYPNKSYEYTCADIKHERDCPTHHTCDNERCYACEADQKRATKEAREQAIEEFAEKMKYWLFIHKIVAVTALDVEKVRADLLKGEKT